MFANAGIAVFPCAPGGKEPLTAHGFHEASADPRRVAVRWRRNPAANLGLPTGGLTAVEVVDIDVHRGGSWFGALERAREAQLVNTWVWLVRTPSGGLHAYFGRAVEVQTAFAHRTWRAPGRIGRAAGDRLAARQGGDPTIEVESRPGVDPRGVDVDGEDQILDAPEPEEVQLA